jgi:hypothetical protein
MAAAVRVMTALIREEAPGAGSAKTAVRSGARSNVRGGAKSGARDGVRSNARGGVRSGARSGVRGSAKSSARGNVRSSAKSGMQSGAGTRGKVHGQLELFPEILKMPGNSDGNCFLKKESANSLPDKAKSMMYILGGPGERLFVD